MIRTHIIIIIILRATGGAIYASSNSRIEISASTVLSGNTAGSGAGLYLVASSVNMYGNVLVTGNIAYQKGSVVYAKGVVK
jgi:hypothetical protein